MSKEEQAIEKIAKFLCLNDGWDWEQLLIVTRLRYKGEAGGLLSLFESLGYIQPKVSPDLEKAITELAKRISQVPANGSMMERLDNQIAIENILKKWLSANNLLRLDPKIKRAIMTEMEVLRLKVRGIVNLWCLCNMREITQTDFFAKVGDFEKGVIGYETKKGWQDFIKTRERIAQKLGSTKTRRR